MDITGLLAILAEGKSLTDDETRAFVIAIMEGQASGAQSAAFLTALRVRGETVDELVGTARVLREKAIPAETGISGILDTCGTGGDASGTFNISTAAALVAAACGVPVAKHGNRSVSSKSGSADVFRALGVNLDIGPEATVRCLREVGIAFFFAPNWHPAMKQVMPVRQQLTFRTIFNLVGPLANPARAEYQLLGVGRIDWLDRVAQSLARLGSKSALVVCAEGGLDEVSLSGKTRVVSVSENKLTPFTWLPKDFDLPTSSINELKVNSAEESADVIRRVFGGEPGPCRNVVLANAAAALFAAGKVESPRAGVRLAAAAIDSKNVNAKLAELVAFTQAHGKTSP